MMTIFCDLADFSWELRSDHPNCQQVELESAEISAKSVFDHDLVIYRDAISLPERENWPSNEHIQHGQCSLKNIKRRDVIQSAKEMSKVLFLMLLESR